MLLYLKIKPNQRFDRIEKIEGEWQVRVNAPAIDGKANEQLVRFLSDVLGLPKSKIRLIKGHTSKLKCLEIEEVQEIVIQKLEKSANKSAH